MRRRLNRVLGLSSAVPDLSYYNDSNEILNHLEQACQNKEPSKYPASLIDFERLVNAERSKEGRSQSIVPFESRASDAQIFQTKLELANLLSNPTLGKTNQAPALFKEVLDFLEKHVPEDKALLLLPKEYLESIGKYKPDPVFPPPDKVKQLRHVKRSS